MGIIRKIYENELIGGVENTDVYPVTSIKAVYDDKNVTLETLLRDIKDSTIPNYLYGKILSITGDGEVTGYINEIEDNESYGNLLGYRNNMDVTNMGLKGRKLTHVDGDLGEGIPLVDSINEFNENSDYIIIQIGYNDIFDNTELDYSTDKSKFKGAFNVYIKGIMTNYPNAKIIIIAPHYFDNSQDIIDKVTWMKKRCEYFHIPFIDGTLLSGLNKNIESQSDYFIDNVHLSKKGHEKMSYIYEDFIRRL